MQKRVFRYIFLFSIMLLPILLFSQQKEKWFQESGIDMTADHQYTEESQDYRQGKTGNDGDHQNVSLIGRCVHGPCLAVAVKENIACYLKYVSDVSQINTNLTYKL